METQLLEGVSSRQLLVGFGYPELRILCTTTQYSVSEIGSNICRLLDMGVFDAKAPDEMKGHAQLAVHYASALGFCLTQRSVNVQRQVPYSRALSLSKQLMGFYRLTVLRLQPGHC